MSDLERTGYVPQRMTENLWRIEDGRGHLEYVFRTAGSQVEIVDIHVDNIFRRQGLGRRMLRCLLSEVIPLHAGVRLVYAITRTSNMIAQRFYEGMHFRVVGILREFYGDSL